MKYLYLFFLYLLIITIPSFAQESKDETNSITRSNYEDKLYEIEKTLEIDPSLGNKLAKDFFVKATKTEDSLLIPFGYYILSRAEYYFGNFQLAYHNSSLALPATSMDINNQLLFNIISHHSSILMSLQEYEAALKINHRYLSALVDKDQIFKMQFLTTIGTIYSYQEKLETAIIKWKQALRIADSIDNKSYMSHLCNNIASNYIQLSNQDSSLTYLEQATRNLDSSEQYMISSYIYYTKAEYYYKFNKFQAALQAVSESISLQKGINDLFTAEAYELKSKILRALGDYKNSDQAMQQYITAYKQHHDNEINIKERKNQLSFELNKSRTDLDILHKQLHFQRRTFYFISIFGILMSIALAISLILNRRRTKRINTYTDITKSQQLELKDINREMEESRGKIIKDANKLMHLNQKLLDSEDKLQQLNVTKDKFFSIIAHDLKNPFASMKNLSDMLHDNYSMLDEEDKQELIASMKITAQRIFDLLENLLTWSRSQRGSIQFHPDIVTPLFIVQNNFDLLAENATNKSIKLINEIQEGMELVADSNLLSTIIRNLTSNAIKFTPDGGSISVGAEDKCDYTEFYVKDTGVGMSPEDIQKLFRIDISHTTIGTGQEKGTGLGLILCKEFVEKHGGRIWVESELAKGTTFKFTIKKMSLENA